MFAVNCPYCQHANKRGARYCADCGAALHLKPCPKCGKVDDVTATQCVNCRTAFPPIELADYRADGEPATATGKAAATDGGGDAGRPTLRAGPLIIIAIVAGGLPFLWMNRERLPTPGELRVRPGSGPAVPTPAATAPVQTLSGVPVAAPISHSAPSAAAPAPARPDPLAEAQPVPVREEPRAAPPTPVPKKEPANAAPRPEKAPERAAIEQRQSVPTPAPTRECTESLLALGLCEKK